MATAHITQARLRELLHYNHDTGIFTWLKSPRRGWVGRVAGSLKGGYLQIVIDTHKQLAHRLAWLYVTGKVPADEIDHIDGNPLNNSFANLRPASRQINNQNIHGARTTNKLGVLGVRRRPNERRFSARITINGRPTFLGAFDTAEEAHDAYLRAKRQHHPGNTL